MVRTPEVSQTGCCVQWLSYATVNSGLLLGTYYLLGACSLLGTRHHLLSACALNRAGTRWRREIEWKLAMASRSDKNTQHTRWSSWSQRKKSYTVFFFRFWLTQSHNTHLSWLIRLSRLALLRGLVKFLPYDAYSSRYPLNIHWLQVTVSWRRMEHSDFTWVLARWT